MLDCEEAKGKRGRYSLVRTYYDASKLFLNGECIRVDGSSGSHEENREFAESYDEKDEGSKTCESAT